MMARIELEQKHGNPDEFARAVRKAYDDLFITFEEAERAIKQYNQKGNIL